MVGKIGWPLAGDTTPAKVASANKLQDPRRPIPGRSHVEFGVGIVGEGTPAWIERDAKRITQSSGQQLPFVALEIGTENMSFARGFAASRLTPGGRVINDIVLGHIHC